MVALPPALPAIQHWTSMTSEAPISCVKRCMQLVMSCSVTICVMLCCLGSVVGSFRLFIGAGPSRCNWVNNIFFASSNTEKGRALVSEIHAFLRSHINLLNLSSSSPLSMIIANFFASPGTVRRSADALLVRSWSVPGCGGDGAVVVRRQVSNKSNPVEFAGSAGAQKGGRETLCLRIMKPR